MKARLPPLLTGWRTQELVRGVMMRPICGLVECRKVGMEEISHRVVEAPKNLLGQRNKRVKQFIGN